MANSLAVILRRTTAQLPKHFFSLGAPCLLDTQIRTLYAPSGMGIDSFVEQRNRIKNQFASISDKFIGKMKEFTSDESHGMVFTEDLKNMIHLAETDEHINLVIRMIRRFTKQNSSMRFGSYIYGPVVMRMLHYYNKPDIAFECFKDPEIGNVFNQLISYQILLDLLYNNGKYEEVLQAFETIKERQIEGAKYPKNCVVLVYAALYKMNTKESFDYGLKLYNELKECGHILMRRAVTFFAALAINQGQSVAALEIIVGLNNQNYVTVRNLKISALCDVGRLEDTIPVLQSIIKYDEPDLRVKQTFSFDVIAKVKEAFDKCDNADLKLEFDRIYDILQSQGHISEETLEEHINKEIVDKSLQRPRDRVQRNMVPFKNRLQEKGRTFQYNRRPGLSDLQ